MALSTDNNDGNSYVIPSTPNPAIPAPELQLQQAQPIPPLGNMPTPPWENFSLKKEGKKALESNKVSVLLHSQHSQDYKFKSANTGAVAVVKQKQHNKVIEQQDAAKLSLF